MDNPEGHSAAGLADDESPSDGDTNTGGPGYALRTLLALEYLATRSSTRDELAEAIDVHRRTSSRLLEVLVGSGWVESDPADPVRYRLGTRVLGVAGDVLGRMSVAEPGSISVKQLRDELGESAHIAVPSRGYAVQLIEASSIHPLAVTTPLGERVPMHASAVGKAIAAYLPAEHELSVKRGLHKYTANTVTTEIGLEKELAITRARGYAVDDEELYLGTRCVAAPVRTVNGAVVASIGVSGPTVRLTRDKIEHFATSVKAAADELSRTLGFRRDEGSP